jgi:hypothetical protein
LADADIVVIGRSTVASKTCPADRTLISTVEMGKCGKGGTTGLPCLSRIAGLPQLAVHQWRRALLSAQSFRSGVNFFEFGAESEHCLIARHGGIDLRIERLADE